MAGSVQCTGTHSRLSHGRHPPFAQPEASPARADVTGASWTHASEVTTILTFPGTTCSWLGVR